MSNPNKRHRAAVAALVISSCLWGMAFLFAKLAFVELSVSHVVIYRFGLASLVLLPIAWLRRAWPRREDLPLFLLTGFLTVGFQTSCAPLGICRPSSETRPTNCLRTDS